MTRRVLTCLSLLVLSAGPAWSAGINLAWDDCPAGAASFLETFACNTEVATTHCSAASSRPPASRR
jgi:hypothetical protein